MTTGRKKGEGGRWRGRGRGRRASEEARRDSNGRREIINSVKWDVFGGARFSAAHYWLTNYLVT